ncbi:TetR/AcrR family transcriptional regulator [Glutamicibacter sp. NPDC127525]|uniref:TetR/AcrR family transcriptional regulator n=1 Tax=unclassified Glutamicibacter TaxID=2627139 RepID=UPI0036405EB9
MAWNTEATRLNLLEAASDEFAKRGFSGARISEISRASGCNRERIYHYFGDKSGLFTAALLHRLVEALDIVPVAGVGPESIAEFAGRYFDYSHENPSLARLTLWEGLELGEPVGKNERIRRSARKISELHNALPLAQISEIEDLLLTIVSLCNASVSTSNIETVIIGEPELSRKRASITRTSWLLAHGLSHQV